MFRIKICGVTRVEDAEVAADAGADAIGLNFYDESPRHVSLQVARLIVKLLPSPVTKVGVFVNHTLEQIKSIVNELKLDVVQLHGDEPAALISQLDDLPVIRAIRCRASDLHEVTEFLDKCVDLGRSPAAVLMDANAPGQYGGTGQVADWNVLQCWSDQIGEIPLVLAGGLNPENIASAIGSVRPTAVDTASGVELSPGVKDHRLLEAFVRSAREAFSSLP